MLCCIPVIIHELELYIHTLITGYSYTLDTNYSLNKHTKHITSINSEHKLRHWTNVTAILNTSYSYTVYLPYVWNISESDVEYLLNTLL
jgi:hypothetical protein